MKILSRLAMGLTVLTFCQCDSIQRKLLFYPTHHARSNGLEVWQIGNETIGYARLIERPQHVWLMLHGNGGQAADRVYALPSFSDRDAVYVLEYPGYGRRVGKPSRKTFDVAAKAAYADLLRRYPGMSIGVVGESIGSGPACGLAKQIPAPAKLVLITPFDVMQKVASEHMSWLPVSLILEAKWDNIDVLKGYRGQVEIFGAADDQVIPIVHAKALADSVPQAVFQRISGGHNDWSQTGEVKVRMNGQ